MQLNLDFNPENGRELGKAFKERSPPKKGQEGMAKEVGRKPRDQSLTAVKE